MQKLAQARDFVAPFDTIEKRCTDLLEMIELVQMENGETLAAGSERD